MKVIYFVVYRLVFNRTLSIYVTNFPYEINTALVRYSGFHFILLPKNIKSFKDDFECSVRDTFTSIVNADIYYYDPQLIASSLAKYFLKDKKLFYDLC